MSHSRKTVPANCPVAQQPTAQRCLTQRSRWSSGMLDCLDDKPVCVVGLLCGPFLACHLAHRLGENCCLPLLPGGAGLLRSSIRHKYNVEGSILDDAIVTYFFQPCSLCQMAREYKTQERKT